VRERGEGGAWGPRLAIARGDRVPGIWGLEKKKRKRLVVGSLYELSDQEGKGRDQSPALLALSGDVCRCRNLEVRRREEERDSSLNSLLRHREGKKSAAHAPCSMTEKNQKKRPLNPSQGIPHPPPGPYSLKEKEKGGGTWSPSLQDAIGRNAQEEKEKRGVRNSKMKGGKEGHCPASSCGSNEPIGKSTFTFSL